MNSNPENAHNKVKIAGEVALALGILAGGTAAGLKIREHRQVRTNLALEYMREAANLPPLEERIQIFGFEEDGATPNLTTQIASFVHLTSKVNGPHATRGRALKKQFKLDDETLADHLTLLHDEGFVGVEQPKGKALNPDNLYFAATPDLEEAERLSKALQEASSYWVNLE